MTGLVAGAIAGLGVAVPIGPVGTALVALATRHRLRVAVAGALGVATADAGFALVATLGGNALAEILAPAAQALHWVCAGALLMVAVATLRAGLRAASGEAQARQLRASQAYLGFLGVTCLNPSTVGYFVALIVAEHGHAGFGGVGLQVEFVGGVLAASAGWQLALAACGRGLGRLLTGARARRISATVGALVIAGLAVHTLVP